MATLEQLQKENALLKKEAEEMVEERDALKERIRVTISDLLKEKKQLKEQNTELKGKLEDLVKERNGLLEKMKVNEAKLADITNLKAEIAMLEEKLKLTEDELAQARATDDKDVRIGKLEQQVKELSVDRTLLMEERNSLKRKLDSGQAIGASTPGTSTPDISERRSLGSESDSPQLSIDESRGSGAKPSASSPTEKSQPQEEGVLWAEHKGKYEIKGGTKEKLIEKLHSNNDMLSSVPEYMQTFLLTYRKFATSAEIMTILQDTYRSATTDKEEISKKQRLRICNFLRKWVDIYFFDFDDELIEAYNSFVDTVYSIGVDESLAAMLHKAMKKSIDGNEIMRTRIFETLPPVPKVPKDPNFTFEDIDPLECARQLTLIEYNLYADIPPKEFLGLAWQKKDKERLSPSLLKMIRRFNEVSNWVATMIVSEVDFKKRTKLVSKFIKIAECCRKLNNFNAIFEITAGLNSAAVHRLKKTWETSGKQKNFEILRTLTSNNASFKEYRAELHTADPPCLPYLGVYLTDLTFIEEGNSDTVGFETAQVVNFFKCRLVADIIKEIQQYQQKPYNLVIVSGITKFLTSQENLDESEQYRRSLIAEPRDAPK